jgi:hypothetical protein
MTELAQVCRELVEIADAAPPGPVRDRMLGDLSHLYARLSALPARVATRAAMKSPAEVRVVLDEEFADAFSGVLRWLQ